MKEFDRWAKRARRAWELGYAVALVSIQDYLDKRPIAEVIFGKSQFLS